MPVALCSLIVALCVAPVFAQPSPLGPEANPGRPTVSTPATLTPVGYLQFESGIFGGVDSPEFSTRVNASEVVKLAVHPRLQLLFFAEPVVHTRDIVSRTSFGDLSAGLQAVAIGGHEAPATVAVSYIHKLRDSGSPDIDLGGPENSVVLLLSTDLLGFHFDTNALANELLNGPTRRFQFGQALSVSHPLKKLTISGEIYHFSQPFLRGRAVGNLWAAAYPLRKNLVVDAGFDRGLTSTSTQWEAFVGFTYVLPHRLW